jgi:hypothetical protein
MCWDIYYFSERLRCRLSKKVQTFNKFLLWNYRLLRKWSFCVPCLRKMPLSPLSLRILDSIPDLKPSLNSTKNFRTRKWDLTTKYLSKITLNLTDAEKTQTFENFVKGRSRQDLTETCLGHLGPSLNHPWSWFSCISLTILFDPRWLQENREGECLKSENRVT